MRKTFRNGRKIWILSLTVALLICLATVSANVFSGINSLSASALEYYTVIDESFSSTLPSTDENFNVWNFVENSDATNNNDIAIDNTHSFGGSTDYCLHFYSGSTGMAYATLTLATPIVTTGTIGFKMRIDNSVVNKYIRIFALQTDNAVTDYDTESARVIENYCHSERSNLSTTNFVYAYLGYGVGRTNVTGATSTSELYANTDLPNSWVYFEYNVDMISRNYNVCVYNLDANGDPLSTAAIISTTISFPASASFTEINALEFGTANNGASDFYIDDLSVTTPYNVNDIIDDVEVNGVRLNHDFSQSIIASCAISSANRYSDFFRKMPSVVPIANSTYEGHITYSTELNAKGNGTIVTVTEDINNCSFIFLVNYTNYTYVEENSAYVDYTVFNSPTIYDHVYTYEGVFRGDKMYCNSDVTFDDLPLGLKNADALILDRYYDDYDYSSVLAFGMPKVLGYIFILRPVECGKVPPAEGIAFSKAIVTDSEGTPYYIFALKTYEEEGMVVPLSVLVNGTADNPDINNSIILVRESEHIDNGTFFSSDFDMYDEGTVPTDWTTEAKKSVSPYEIETDPSNFDFGIKSVKLGSDTEASNALYYESFHEGSMVYIHKDFEEQNQGLKMICDMFVSDIGYTNKYNRIWLTSAEIANPMDKSHLAVEMYFHDDDNGNMTFITCSLASGTLHPVVLHTFTDAQINDWVTVECLIDVPSATYKVTLKDPDGNILNTENYDSPIGFVQSGTVAPQTAINYVYFGSGGNATSRIFLRYVSLEVIEPKVLSNIQVNGYSAYLFKQQTESYLVEIPDITAATTFTLTTEEAYVSHTVSYDTTTHIANITVVGENNFSRTYTVYVREMTVDPISFFGARGKIYDEIDTAEYITICADGTVSATSVAYYDASDVLYTGGVKVALTTTDFYLPTGTTVIMLDFSWSTPKYYYYLCTAATNSIELTDFTIMGATDGNYSYPQTTPTNGERLTFVIDFFYAEQYLELGDYQINIEHTYNNGAYYVFDGDDYSDEFHIVEDTSRITASIDEGTHTHKDNFEISGVAFTPKNHKTSVANLEYTIMVEMEDGSPFPDGTAFTYNDINRPLLDGGTSFSFALEHFGRYSCTLSTFNCENGFTGDSVTFRITIYASCSGGAWLVDALQVAETTLTVALTEESEVVLKATLATDAAGTASEVNLVSPSADTVYVNLAYNEATALLGATAELIHYENGAEALVATAITGADEDGKYAVTLTGTSATVALDISDAALSKGSYALKFTVICERRLEHIRYLKFTIY